MIEEATRCGIAVGNTPSVLSESCADLTFGLILAVARKIALGDQQIRTGERNIFDQTLYIGTDVHGATLGIIGLRQIGLALARRAAGFDMGVLYTSRNRKPDAEKYYGVHWMPDLKSLPRDSDFVSVHVPLSSETRCLIGRTALEQMKPVSFLINASRGGTVDPRALFEALSSGTIAGAALDVTEPEPIPIDDPLLSLPNLVITPHTSSASATTFRNMGLMAANNITAPLTDRPMPSCVNSGSLESARYRRSS